MKPTIRVLRSGDEARLEAFLVQHADTSMFLRSNARTAGLEYFGAAYQGTYVAAFDGEGASEREGDAIVAVASHTWNGMIMVQAPTALTQVVRGVVAESARAVTGFSGPYAHVVGARAALGLERAETSMQDREDLFALDLDRLVVPEVLARGDVRCIRPRVEDVATITEWRIAYCIETMGDRDSPEMRETCRRDMARAIEGQRSFVLIDACGRAVAYSGFNAELPDCVQIGGVYTPKDNRGRGYARAAVAGSLLVARAAGVTRSILFTNEANVPAVRAYLSLGYAIIGDYGLVRFPNPVQPMHVAPLDGTFQP